MRPTDAEFGVKANTSRTALLHAGMCDSFGRHHNRTISLYLSTSIELPLKFAALARRV